jgi:hypothetical protein
MSHAEVDHESKTTRKTWILELAAGRLCRRYRFYLCHLWPAGIIQRFREHTQRPVVIHSPGYAQSHAHYHMIPGPGSWLFTFVLGMAMGGFIGGRTFSKTVRDLPPVWRSRFGDSAARRYAATFLGGFLILFASRLAGGCTLGLFISGSTQLAWSGLYFGVLIFGFAMLTARLVYGHVAKEEK